MTRTHLRGRYAAALRLAVMGLRTVELSLVLAGVLLVACPRAFALDPALDVSQYAHTAWKIRDGFTKGAIYAIAQTPDGYLWLGTEFGLYRFDGVRAEPWQPPAGEQLPSDNIHNLLVARDGTLWIGTMKGLASWKDGRLIQYPEASGQIVTSLLQDHEKTVWFGLDAPGRLCAIQGRNVQCYGAGSFGQYAFPLYEEAQGNLWVSTETGLWRWKPGPPEHYRSSAGLFADAAIGDDNGRLLLATAKGLKQFSGGRIQDYALPRLIGQFRPAHFLRSGDGSLWIGTFQGLLHLHQGRADAFGAADGLSDDYVSSIFEDGEGNVWVATLNGLDRFREYAVQTISRNQGLSTSNAYSVQASADGTIWIGTTNGLNRWQNGHVVLYGKLSGASQSGRRDGRELSISGAETEIMNSGFAGIPRSLGLDDQRRLWVSSGDGVFYFENNRFIRVIGAPSGNIWSIAGDGHGKMWISDPRLGLFCWGLGRSVQQIPWSRFGQKPLGALALLPDRSQGGVWLGFYDGGLAYFKDGQIRASYTSADGLGNGRVNDLRFGSRGTLWAATEGGLSRIRDGHVATLTSKNGLPCDAVHWSVEDNEHFVWLYMPCGLARVARSELDEWVSDSSRKIQLAIFDNSDGVTSVGAYGGYGPHVTKSPDGRIWFVHVNGVSIIDPRHLPHNDLPPPVHIEQITADRKVSWQNSWRDGSSTMRLPALTRDVEFDYTALSFVVPEKVRFRYKLEDRDRDWQDAGNRRQAFYSDLPPRNYRFRVMACNNSGVWNEAGAFLDFSVAPAYYQTTWFRLSCVAAFLALLWALYQVRLRQVAREFNAGLEVRVAERTRIARELHDTLLQSFQGLLMRFQAVSNELADGEAKQELDGAIERAARAITEGRDAVQGLRSSAVESNDLAAAIGALGKELPTADSRSPEFTVQVEGAGRKLHPILRDEVYRVAGEALRNAFRHADAQHIEVEIRYDERRFRLRVRDDGKGIDPTVLDGDGRAGHFGLRGMRERAMRVGGKLTVWSELQSGTEVELSIPAAHAYTAVRAAGRGSWLARKLSSKDRETGS